MVKLDNFIISKSIVKKNSKTNRTSEDEINPLILQKLTHIYFQHRGVHTIGNISMCSNVKVLYLQGNSITKIENLDFVKKLTHLYLQNNKISKIENLENLNNLEKLFLGHNFITVVEGLEKLTNLKELHLEKQTLPHGEALQFDPRTIESLSESLHFLDISHNRVSSLRDLHSLKNLRELYASNNSLQDIKEVCECLSGLFNLQSLDLTRNPINSLHKYRDSIIISASPNLDFLDKKDVHEVRRQFIQNFDSFKKQLIKASNQEITTDEEGFMVSNKSKQKGNTDLTLYNMSNKTGLVAVNPLFPPWGSRQK